MKTRYRSLREYLQAAQLTQSEFAKHVGTTQGTVSKAANGRGVSLRLAVAIAKAAQIPVESLIANEEAY